MKKLLRQLRGRNNISWRGEPQGIWGSIRGLQKWLNKCCERRRRQQRKNETQAFWKRVNEIM